VTYLLDTNMWIAHLRIAVPQVTQRLLAQDPRENSLCSVVVAELHYGALRSGRPVENLNLLAGLRQRFVSLPFDDRAAAEYGEIRSDLARRGMPIGANDLLIAAIARSHALTLVTHNSGEFARVTGLAIEDWQ